MWQAERTTDSPLPDLHLIQTQSWDMINRVLYPLCENKNNPCHIALADTGKPGLCLFCSLVFRQISLMMKHAFT